MTRTLFFGATLFLGGCVTSEENPSDIDPSFAQVDIDAQIAGRTLAGSFELAGEWVGLPSLPAEAGLQTSLSARIAALGKTTALAKRSDPGLDAVLNIDLEDTAKGYATVYAQYQLLLVKVTDTAIVKWDDKARDGIDDNENILSFKRVQIHPAGKVETAQFTDGDGDGLVSPTPGRKNLAKLTVTVTDKGAMETASLVVDAGADADFDLEGDNTILKAEWTRAVDGSLRASSVFLDADGDGVILDHSKDCLVEVKHAVLRPRDRPLVVRADFEAKVRLMAGKAGEEPVTLYYREEMIGGRINTIAIKNGEGGSEIKKGENLTVRLETHVPSGKDTLKSADIEIVMNPGMDLNSDSDDVCLEIHIATRKRFGLEREAEFHFISAEPIPHGREPVAGRFHGEATYANGKKAGLSGEFSPEGFSAEFAKPDGSVVKVTYGKNGGVVAGG